MKIHLDKGLKNIAVRLSGGPDSSIIYHAVCDFYRDDPDARIYPYTVSTPLRPHSGPKAKKVVEVVTALTGVAPALHYVRWHDAHNQQNDRETNSIEYTKGQDLLMREIFSTHGIDIHYSGLSMNCPVGDLERTVIENGLDAKACEFSIRTRDDSRDVPTEKPLERLNGKIMCLPFAERDKRAVSETFAEYGVLDSLFPHTWSCEHNSQKDIEEPEHCGKCYFCIERIYAFGRLV